MKKFIQPLGLIWILCALAYARVDAGDSPASPAESAGSTQAIPASAAQDPVLRAMSAELERSRAQLKLQNMQRPYYLEYSLVDMDLYASDAAFGAVRLEQRQRARMLRVVVRIGDYKQDSYFGQGQGTIDLAPVDDDELALRHQLWLTTDRAYKAAIESLTRKQAALKQFENEVLPDDFAQEPVAQHLAPTARLDFDPARWRETLKTATALYRKDPDLQSLQAGVLFRVQTRYFMNSEGSVLREPETEYVVTVSGSTQAPDGMRLDRGKSYVMATPGELPSLETVRSDTDKLIATLATLRGAPVAADEYSGPILFGADAAADVFARLVGNNLAGHRPRPGTPARTTGDYATSYKARVLPEFLSVSDDPTTANFGGRSLIGSYAYDDEGVKAQPVKLIEKGELVNYLLGRTPIRDFPQSNGHGRGPLAPTPAMGNLFVRSSQPLSPDALKQKLIAICKERGLPYCYRVESVSSTLAPQLLYRVWANDGHEEMVRGGEFNQLDARALRNDVIAAGDDARVDNRMEQNANSVIAPSILFGELVVKRSGQAKDKLPDYPAPALPGAAGGRAAGTTPSQTPAQKAQKDTFSNPAQ